MEYSELNNVRINLLKHNLEHQNVLSTKKSTIKIKTLRILLVSNDILTLNRNIRIIVIIIFARSLDISFCVQPTFCYLYPAKMFSSTYVPRFPFLGSKSMGNGSGYQQHRWLVLTLIHFVHLLFWKCVELFMSSTSI